MDCAVDIRRATRMRNLIIQAFLPPPPLPPPPLPPPMSSRSFLPGIAGASSIRLSAYRNVSGKIYGHLELYEAREFDSFARKQCSSLHCTCAVNLVLGHNGGVRVVIHVVVSGYLNQILHKIVQCSTQNLYKNSKSHLLHSDLRWCLDTELVHQLGRHRPHSVLLAGLPDTGSQQTNKSSC